MLSREVFEDLEVRARLTLPALGVLDPGDRAPDGVVKEGDLGRPVRVWCDPSDQGVQVLVAAIAKMQGPQRAVAAQSQLFEQDDEGPLALPYRRLFAGSPGQYEVLDRRPRPWGACDGRDQFCDLPVARSRDEMKPTRG